MTEPTPISLAKVQQQAARQEAKQAIARQVSSADRFTAQVEEGFNPAAAERQQSRNSRFRNLDSRKKETEQTATAIKAVSAKTEEDLARDFHQRNPELPADKLRNLRRALAQDQSPEEILRSVIEAFEDPTLADEALEYLEKTSSGTMQENVKEARKLIKQKLGREIAAGKNVDTVAKNFQKQGAGTATDFRNLYRDITGNPRDHNTLFSELANMFKFSELKDVVAFLLRGMSYDLKSKGPSIERQELLRLMTETRNLQSILWVYLFFKSRMKLIKYMYKKYGLIFGDEGKNEEEDKDEEEDNEHEDERGRFQFEALAKTFIKIVEDRYPSVLKVLKQTEQLGLVEDAEKAIVITQFRDAIRQLSPRLYKSIRHRQDILLAIIEALEELEEEDEEDEE